MYKSLDNNFVSIKKHESFFPKNEQTFSISGQCNPYHQPTYRFPPLHPISAIVQNFKVALGYHMKSFRASKNSIGIFKGLLETPENIVTKSLDGRGWVATAIEWLHGWLACWLAL